jgi:hypothetical protein
MAAVRSPRPVNLICGLISSDPDLMARAVRLLEEYQGRCDALSDTWVFDKTDYYTVEMGEGLLRRFVSFEQLIDPGQLSSIKLLTNGLERRVCHELGLPEDQRRVNLDPGYITLSKLVLATTKDFSHRVYVGGGIYAETTLHFENGHWIAWPWTYPDYAGPQYQAFFEHVRELYKAKLNERGQVRLPQSGPSGAFGTIEPDPFDPFGRSDG